MMDQKSQVQLIKLLEEESKMTERVLSVLKDTVLPVQISNNTRPIGQLAWHIVYTVGEMLSKTGLKVEGYTETLPSEIPVGTTVSELLTLYKQFINSAIISLKDSFPDEKLFESINLYGEDWTRAYAIEAMVRHEIHHRAQLIFLLRAVGFKVPGLYGPAQEEWQEMGLPIPK
ncbi:MAG: DinB family protein [Chloroherpetonaceae bacterium]|nr:DinB family protein [Chloroherpetonaceae bacterium]